MIGSVKVNGVILEEPYLIKAAAVSHFKERFHQEKMNRTKIGGVFNRRIFSEQAERLENPFELEKITAAFKDCQLKSTRTRCLQFFFHKESL